MHSFLHIWLTSLTVIFLLVLFSLISQVMSLLKISRHFNASFIIIFEESLFAESLLREKYLKKIIFYEEYLCNTSSQALYITIQKWYFSRDQIKDLIKNKNTIIIHKNLDFSRNLMLFK